MFNEKVIFEINHLNFWLGFEKIENLEMFPKLTSCTLECNSNRISLTYLLE